MEKMDLVLGKLMNTEEFIYNNLKFMCEIEQMGLRESDEYERLLNLYNLAIIDEEALLSNLSEDELSTLKNCMEKSSKSVSKKIFDRIMDRIKHYQLCLKSSNMHLSSDISKNEVVISKTTSYILSEWDQIYLSFLDEYISSASTDLKRKLLEEKYKVIFNLKRDHEKSLIDNGLHTDYSLYLCSQIKSQIEGVSVSTFLGIKDALTTSLYYKFLKTLLKLPKNSIQLTLNFLRFRTTIIMFDNTKFNIEMEKLNRIKGFDTNDNFQIEPLLHTFNLDQERHMRLSIGGISGCIK